jgi:hypothetical protein
MRRASAQSVQGPHGNGDLVIVPRCSRSRLCLTDRVFKPGITRWPWCVSAKRLSFSICPSHRTASKQKSESIAAHDLNDSTHTLGTHTSQCRKCSITYYGLEITYSSLRNFLTHRFKFQHLPQHEKQRLQHRTGCASASERSSFEPEPKYQSSSNLNTGQSRHSRNSIPLITSTFFLRFQKNTT